MVDSLLIATPLATGAGTLGFFGWQHRKREQRAKDMEIQRRLVAHLRWAAPILTVGEARQVQGELVGSVMGTAVGTYGSNQLLRVLRLLEQCGMDALVGSLLMIENDQDLRLRFFEQMPEIYRDRVKFGFSESYSGGASNRDADWMRDDVDIWGVAIDKSAGEVIDLHLRRQGNRSPSLILAFISLGGQVSAGLVALDPIHARFEETLVIGCTTLPAHRRLRQNFPEVKAEYEQYGVHGWLVEDNLGPDPVTADAGMVVSIVGLAEAALHADRPTQPNNVFSLALTKEAGGIVVYQVEQQHVVAHPFQPDRTWPLVYYAPRQALLEWVQKGLRKVAVGEGSWSTGRLPLLKGRTSTFDLVATNLGPADLTLLEDSVNRGRELYAKFGRNGTSKIHATRGEPDYDTIFAGINAVIDPETPSCTVVVVRLSAIESTPEMVAELVKPPNERSFPTRSPEQEATDQPSAENPSHYEGPTSRRARKPRQSKQTDSEAAP